MQEGSPNATQNIIHMGGTPVAYHLERSACNVDSTGSSLDRDSYCAATLSQSYTRNCSAIISHLPPPSRRGTALLCSYEEERYNKKVSCIVLYCFVGYIIKSDENGMKGLRCEFGMVTS